MVVHRPHDVGQHSATRSTLGWRLGKGTISEESQYSTARDYEPQVRKQYTLLLKVLLEVKLNQEESLETAKVAFQRDLKEDDNEAWSMNKFATGVS